MSTMGFSLNLVSLLAITLVTGILVDDAIVEIENIVRHMRMGKSPYRAALEAADEIGLAVIAITFTIVAVFAPVSFMGGIAGQYFKQFGITVAAAVLISLLVARLDHADARGLFHAAAQARGGARRLHHARLYAPRRLVGPAQVHHLRPRPRLLCRLDLRRPASCPPAFLPEEDVSRSLFVVELPPGARLDDTQADDRRARRAPAQMPEVRRSSSTAARSFPARRRCASRR